MDLRILRYFLAVAEEGNITRADDLVDAIRRIPFWHTETVY